MLGVGLRGQAAHDPDNVLAARAMLEPSVVGDLFDAVVTGFRIEFTLISLVLGGKAPPVSPATGPSPEDLSRAARERDTTRVQDFFDSPAVDDRCKRIVADACGATRTDDPGECMARGRAALTDEAAREAEVAQHYTWTAYLATAPALGALVAVALRARRGRRWSLELEPPPMA